MQSLANVSNRFICKSFTRNRSYSPGQVHFFLSTKTYYNHFVQCFGIFHQTNLGFSSRFYGLWNIANIRHQKTCIFRDTQLIITVNICNYTINSTFFYNICPNNRLTCSIDNFSFNCHLTTLCSCALLIARKQYDLGICYFKTDSDRIQHFIHSLANSFILYGKANLNLNIDFSGIIKKCIATSFLYFRHSL